MKLPRDIIFYTLFGIVILLVGVAAHNLYEINLAMDRLQDLKEATSTHNYEYVQTVEVR